MIEQWREIDIDMFIRWYGGGSEIEICHRMIA